jgi:hypothetical protein
MQWPTDDRRSGRTIWPALASEARTVLKFQRIQTQGNVSLRECLIKQLLQALLFRMKRYRLKLPAKVAHMVLAMASLMQKADAEQGELFKQTVRSCDF